VCPLDREAYGATSAVRRPASTSCTAATLNSSVNFALGTRSIQHLRYRTILRYRRYPIFVGQLTRAARNRNPAPCYLHRRPKEARHLFRYPQPILVCKKTRKLFLNPIPRHATREHCKQVSEIDHLVQSGAEKISRINLKHLSKISEELRQITPVSGRFRHHSIALQASIRAGFRNIAGPTFYRRGRSGPESQRHSPPIPGRAIARGSTSSGWRRSII
jgi:hypothetical protein